MLLGAMLVPDMQVTGQEVLKVPGSCHVSCTAEMAALNTHADVAIIDEIQVSCLMSIAERVIARLACYQLCRVVNSWFVCLCTPCYGVRCVSCDHRSLPLARPCMVPARSAES